MEEYIAKVTSLFGDLLDAGTLFLFCNAVLSKDKSRLNRVFTFLIFVVGHIVWGYICVSINNYFILFFGGILETFGLLFLYRIKIYSKVFISFGFYCIAAASEMIVSGILSKITDDSSDTLYYYGMISSKLIMLVIVIVIAIVVRRKIYVNEKKYMFSMLICPVLSMVIIALFVLTPEFQERKFNAVIGLIGLLIVAMNMAVFYMLDNIREISELKEKEAAVKNDMEIQSKNVAQIMERFRQVRMIIHDSNKHLKSIRQYVEEDRKSDALEYIDSTLHTSNKVYKYINTGNMVIDALVSDVMNRCDKTGIECRTDIHIDNKILTDNYDMTTILGNLLDNAYNAVKTKITGDKYIDIKIVAEQDKCIIIVSNPITEQQISHMVKSYGIENVERATEKNGGVYNTKIENGIYIANVILPFN